MPLFIFLVMANVPTFFFMNEIELDAKDCSFTSVSPNTVIDGEEYYVGESSFPMYVYIVTVWIGLLMTSICGGIGLIFLPYNLLNDFIFRPKPIKKADFGKRQKILLPKLLNLRREGKRLENERMQVALMTGCTGYARRYEYNKQMRVWETCTILAEKEFRKL